MSMGKERTTGHHGQGVPDADNRYFGSKFIDGLLRAKSLSLAQWLGVALLCGMPCALIAVVIAEQWRGISGPLWVKFLNLYPVWLGIAIFIAILRRSVFLSRSRKNRK